MWRSLVQTWDATDAKQRALVTVAVIGALYLVQREQAKQPNLRLLQAQVIDQYAGERPSPLPPRDVSEQVLSGAERKRLPGGGTVTLTHANGAAYLYDRSRLERWNGEAETAALRAMYALDARSGSSHGVLVIGTSGDGEEPLRIRLHRSAPPAELTEWDAAAEHDLDLESGDLVMEPNGDGAASLVVELPPGRYRARTAVHFDESGWSDRFALDLWPRTGTAKSRVLKRLRAG